MYDHHYKEKKESFKKTWIQKIFTIDKNLNRGLTVLKGEITLVLFKKTIMSKVCQNLYQQNV